MNWLIRNSFHLLIWGHRVPFWRMEFTKTFHIHEQVSLVEPCLCLHNFCNLGLRLFITLKQLFGYFVFPCSQMYAMITCLYKVQAVVALGIGKFCLFALPGYNPLIFALVTCHAQTICHHLESDINCLCWWKSDKIWNCMAIGKAFANSQRQLNTLCRQSPGFFSWTLCYTKKIIGK